MGLNGPGLDKALFPTLYNVMCCGIEQWSPLDKRVSSLWLAKCVCSELLSY